MEHKLLRCYQTPELTPPNSCFELKGYKLEGNIVHYSTVMKVKEDTGREQEYLPTDSVEQKVLSKEQAERIEYLTEGSRFARRIVARDEDWHLEMRGSFHYWVLRGDYERFIAHKIGPVGTGSELNDCWQEISDIILGEGGTR